MLNSISPAGQAGYYAAIRFSTGGIEPHRHSPQDMLANLDKVTKYNPPKIMAPSTPASMQPLPPERHARSWLAYTEYQLNPAQIQTQLQTAKVAIIGLGGLGGYVLEHLVRLGVGQLRLVDADKFSPSNLNRQLLCTNNTLGRSKVQVARERALSLNGQVRIETYPYLATESNLPEILQDITVVVDALDSIPSRFKLVQAARIANIPVVYGAVHGCYGQASVILPGDHTLESIYPDFENLDNNIRITPNAPNKAVNINTNPNPTAINKITKPDKATRLDAAPQASPSLQSPASLQSSPSLQAPAPLQSPQPAPLSPSPPPPGVLSPIVGAIAAVQAQEVFKLITNQPDTLQHKLFSLDLMQSFCQILDLSNFNR